MLKRDFDINELRKDPEFERFYKKTLGYQLEELNEAFMVLYKAIINDFKFLRVFIKPPKKIKYPTEKSLKNLFNLLNK